MSRVVHFNNFDAIRAVAAISVLASHIEQRKSIYGLKAFSTLDIIPLGAIAVTLFFVLSGFLITFLLLTEHATNGKINIKHFYIRRILRIWPLYFIILLAGILFWGDEISMEGRIYSVFFLPNIAYLKSQLPNFIAPIWSIGIEEQFYIVFPILFLFKQLRSILYSIIIIFLSLLALRLYSYLYEIKELKDYLYLARFDCMAIGAIASFLYFYYLKQVKWFIYVIDLLHSKTTQYASLILTTAYLLAVFLYSTPIIHQIFAVLFAIILINLGTNKTSIINLRSRFLDKIGIVSYGIYLTHPFTNHLVLQYVHSNNLFFENLLIYGISISLSILTANIIYYTYEIYFINLKSRFSFAEKRSALNS